MKIKELISKLKELDPDANIWLLYDRYSVYEPEITLIKDISVSSDILNIIDSDDYCFDAD